MDDKNKQLAELLKVPEIDFCSDVGRIQLLELMMKREDSYKFLAKINDLNLNHTDCISMIYILDPNKLRDAAMEWLKKLYPPGAPENRLANRGGNRGSGNPWSQPQYSSRPNAEIRHPPLIHERQIRVATVCLTEESSYKVLTVLLNTVAVLLNTMPASDSLPFTSVALSPSYPAQSSPYSRSIRSSPLARQLHGDSRVAEIS